MDKKQDRKQKDRLGRTMTQILRHGANQVGIEMNNQGYVRVDDLMNVGKLKRYDPCLEFIQQIVKDCPKQRYEMYQSGSTFYIRATQGHSLKQVESDAALVKVISLEQLNDEINRNLKRMDKPILKDCIRYLVHGTYHKFIDSIKQGGLQRMTRNHVHLAIPSDESVVSGMRRSVDTILKIEIEPLLNSGMDLYLSSNNVVLTEGPVKSEFIQFT